MRSFIQDVLINVLNTHTNVSQLTFILPSKRAGYFLKNQLAQLTNKTLISPEVLSIEEFTQHLSQLTTIGNTELLFQFYEVYLELTPKEKVEPFDTFSKWAQIIIQDFNEIDRYLIDSKQVFNYLSAIKEVDHWSLEEQQTELTKNYLSFWNALPQYYELLTDKLISSGQGYQGLIYREAVEKLEYYIDYNAQKHHVFLGFNALNTAEQTIIKELLNIEIASVFWDIDSAFLNSTIHDAGLFLNDYIKWPFFKKNSFKWMNDSYAEPKNIECVGIPKNVGQAKFVGQLLSDLKQKNKNLSNTALVLGDESLLTPVLNSIPSEIGSANITMGLPLNNVPLSALFSELFQLHKKYSDNFIYYKDVTRIISNPYISPILYIDEKENASKAIARIAENNITYVSVEKLRELLPSNKTLINFVFNNWNNNIKTALENSLSIIYIIKNHLSANKRDNALPLEYLFRFYQVFNQLSLITKKNNYITSIASLFNLYKEVLTNETLDFKGEPLQGLQILGMLETRVIDFETVIITSVNEGVLPSGKSNNSFIPFDVKLQYGLPTYKEKDAVYTYHFYHLLQRAKNVFILYNTEIEGLQGGEKSRFITQLKAEGIHKIKEYAVSSNAPATNRELKIIQKTEGVLHELKALASKGFSPSSLTSYIRNPFDFYKQKILGLNTFEDVEETVATNTLGTILHNTLEELYLPYINSYLNQDSIKSMHAKIDASTTKNFKKAFKEGAFDKGKNLIVFEIIKRYITNFLNHELEEINNGNSLKIIALEKNLTVNVNIEGVDFPVNLTGTVDRIDLYNDTLRIIDYKSGKVEQSKVEIVDWEDITSDYNKYSKSFQVLCYALMMKDSPEFRVPLEAGIISFKNLNQGFLKFAQKESPRSRNKNAEITNETLDNFEIELKKLILEICNPTIDFIEKET